MISGNLRSCEINLMSSLGCKEKNFMRSPQVSNNVPRPLVLPMDTECTQRRIGSPVKNISQCIENEPKEEWILLYDTDGSRYGIMTTNFGEVYNLVMLLLFM
jgi:hypothetical protein